MCCLFWLENTTGIAAKHKRCHIQSIEHLKNIDWTSTRSRPILSTEVNKTVRGDTLKTEDDIELVRIPQRSDYDSLLGDGM